MCPSLHRPFIKLTWFPLWVRGWCEILVVSNGGLSTIASLGTLLYLQDSPHMSPPVGQLSSGSTTKPVMSFSVHTTALCPHLCHGPHWVVLGLSVFTFPFPHKPVCGPDTDLGWECGGGANKPLPQLGLHLSVPQCPYL